MPELKECYQCGKKAVELSPRSRCVTCEHQRANFNSWENQDLRAHLHDQKLLLEQAFSDGAYWMRRNLVNREFVEPRPVEPSAAAYASRRNPPRHGMQFVALMCPAKCGCVWRDNHDGTMSLFGPNSKPCDVCEQAAIDDLIPVYAPGWAQKYPSGKDGE